MRDISINFFIIILILTIISCTSKKKNKNYEVKRKKNDNSSILRIEKFSFTNAIKGKEIWRLISELAIINNSTKLANLEKVEINYKNRYFIYSEKGKYNMKDDIAVLMDHVMIINKDNDTFYTDKLTFYSKQKKVISNSKVKFLGGNIFLTANSMVGFFDKKKFILKGNVYSEIK